MRIYTLSIVAVVLIVISVVRKTFIVANAEYKKFSTAKGEVDIEEINKNVFEVNGYTLAKNGIIPVLKRKIPMTCNNVFDEWQKVAENGLTIDPPKVIPNPSAFLLNNYTKLSEWYFNETPKNTNQTLKNWNETFIDALVETAKSNPQKIPLSYGDESLSVYAATKDFGVKGQVGAVIGSQTPWVEIYLLANGAERVTTVDYYQLSIEHPKMDFLYAPDLPSKKEDYFGAFDFIVSFSSIEHSGLGRYGDPIDPIGDIREMNKIHCMLKPKGLLYLGLPVGVDTILFNAHRIYGRIRLAMMFEGFKLLKIYRYGNLFMENQLQKVFTDGSCGHKQYLFVLEKQKSC